MKVIRFKKPEHAIMVSGNTFPIGFVLFCIFLVLKLTGVITWSWWWVTSPLWLPFAVIIGLAFLIFIACVLVDVKKMDDLNKQANKIRLEKESK